ncbi:amidohydrolase [Minicystis rosea]|nr:amidohydrolase [Minicystis rosea]
MLALSLLALTPALASCRSEAAAQTPPAVGCPSCTVLRGGMVFDGVRKGRGTVVMEGKKVREIVFGDAPVTAGEVVDVAGKTVMPGLLDLHVHLLADSGPLNGGSYEGVRPDDHMKSMLRAGVTSFLDLGTSAHVIFEYRKRIDAGEMIGPRVFAVGPLLTPTGGHPCYAGTRAGDSCFFIDAPSDVGKAFSKLVAYKPDAVKIVIESGPVKPLPRMTEASMAAVEQAAAAAGLPVFAHVSYAKDVEDALTAGITHFAHLPNEDLISPALAQKMAAMGVVIVPTAAVMDGFYRVSHGTVARLDERALRDDVPGDVIDSLQDPQELGYMTTSKYKAMTATWRSNVMANLKTCHAAGVTIAGGTDAGNPGTFHGLAMADELALYVEAGMSPVEALASGTRTAAEVLGRHDLGRLEPGAIADVLVVDGDATTNIRNVGRVSRVYRAGALVDRGALALRRSTSLTTKPTTQVAAGGTCLTPSDCGHGLMCNVDHVCAPTCNGFGGCAKGSACVPDESAASGGYCYASDGCDPIRQTCGNGTACVPLGNAATACWDAGTGAHGKPCSAEGSCAVGSTCNLDTNACMDICDPSGAAGKRCSAGKKCVDASSWTGLAVGLCQ